MQRRICACVYRACDVLNTLSEVFAVFMRQVKVRLFESSAQRASACEHPEKQHRHTVVEHVNQDAGQQ